MLFGPGATASEILLYLLATAGSGIAMVLSNFMLRDINWTYRLKRPVAIALSLAGYFAEISLFEAVIGIEWFAILLFLKIFNGLMVQEEPYRPV